MRIFIDEQGHEWKLSWTAAAMMRFKRHELDPATQLFEDCGIETLVRILWTWLEPQIAQLGITEEQFAERMHGPAIAQAYLAAQEECRDFFLATHPPRGLIIQRMMEAVDLLTNTAAEAAATISPSGLSLSASA